MKTLIEKYTQNNPKVLFSCFIDLRKAFDKVRHDGLLYQDEGKELVDKTKLNVLLKLFNRNDWLLFNISFNIMSMQLLLTLQILPGLITFKSSMITN
jgi:hypothetical protein